MLTRSFILAVMALGLSGCWVPATFEQSHATVRQLPDGRVRQYDFSDQKQSEAHPKKEIRLGMSIAEVKTLLGEPHQTRVKDGKTVLRYYSDQWRVLVVIVVPMPVGRVRYDLVFAGGKLEKILYRDQDMS
jgi:hypothetical protein